MCHMWTRYFQDKLIRFVLSLAQFIFIRIIACQKKAKCIFCKKSMQNLIVNQELIQSEGLDLYIL